MSDERKGAVFSPTERALALALLMTLVPGALYGAWLANAYQRQAVAEDDAQVLVGALGGRVGEIDTMMSSLLGMHYASVDFESGEIGTLAERLQARYPFLAGIGRYASVPAAERARFEREASGNGVYDFRIVDIDAEGRRRPSAPRERHAPISTIEPRTPTNVGMVGADLASVEGLGARLERLAALDEPLLARLPEGWHLAGDLVIAHPTYLGRQPPLDPTERVAQLDGGYWIAVDGERLIESLPETGARFDVDVRIIVTDGVVPIASRADTADETLWLRELFAPRVIVADWAFGGTHLNVRLTHPIGMPPRNAAIAGTALLLTLAAFGMIAAFVRHGRRAALWRGRSLALLDAEREKAKRTLDSISEAVLALDAEQRVAQLNPAAERLLGTRRDDALGEHVDTLIRFRRTDDGAPFDLVATLASMVPNEHREIDLHPTETHGEERVLTLSLTGGDGEHAGHIIVVRDVSHERRLTRELEHLANHDSLTGCTNRYYFERRLGELVAESASSGRTHALCYIDLDQFKVINDTCGHVAGDRLLQELTMALRALVRRDDVLSRLGGDEFGVIVVDVSREEATRVAETLFAFFQGYLFQHEDKAFAVRASMGLVHIDAGSGAVGDLLAAADIACYAAKDSGRNSLRTYSDEDAALIERSSELAWLPRLRNALERDEFRLHLQAVAAIGPDQPAGHVSHFEFLLRLADVDGREITPWQIIQAAERYDLMRDLDRWVVRRAFDTVAALADGPGGRCSYSINLSGQSAADPSLKTFIAAEIVRSGVDPQRIWFELTETAAISHFTVAHELLGNLRELGVKIALDDFGSGLSSFGYLKNLPIDVIKIDGQFVRNIVTDRTDREMVRAIHQVGVAMGVETVAEFVEDAAILDELVAIGVDYAQGYHIGKPCPVEEAIASLPPLDRAA